MMRMNIVFNNRDPGREDCLIGRVLEIIDLGEALEVGPNHRRFGVLYSGVLRVLANGDIAHATPEPFQLVCQEVEPGEFVEIVP